VSREEGQLLEDDPTGGRKIFRVMKYEQFHLDTKEGVEAYNDLLSRIDFSNIINITMPGYVAHIIYLTEVIKVDRKEHDALLPVIETEPQQSLFPKSME